MRIKWFGHAAFKVEIDGVKFLVDPWLSSPVSKGSINEVLDVDFIIVTHDHGDHLGDSIQIMKRSSKPKFIGIFEIANYVAEQIGTSERVIDGNIGGPIDLGNKFFVVLTPALHSSSRGAPTGAVFGREGEVAYHAGDTGLTYDMKLIGDLYKPKVAMLPIGGHYTMGPREAAKAAELIRPRYLIPMHYGTFPVIKGKPEELRNYLKEFDVDTELIVLKPGEEVEL